MGRIANYREKLDVIRKCNPALGQSVRLLTRLIDSLESVGLIDGTSGFCLDVATATGYSRNRVSDILSGKGNMSDRFLTSLCSVYGLDKHYILTGEGEAVSGNTDISTGAAMKQSPAIEMAVKVLEGMSEPDQYRAVAWLLELKDNNELLLQSADQVKARQTCAD